MSGENLIPGEDPVLRKSNPNLPRLEAEDKQNWVPKIDVSKKCVLGTYIVPVLVFSQCILLVAFKLRHVAPLLVCTVVIIELVSIVLLLWYVSYWWRIGRLNYKKWYLIYCVLIVWSFVGGLVMGDRIYFQQSYAWFTYQDLGNYVEVDPAKARGQSYMDAGTVIFKTGTIVSKPNARAYKNQKVYCVAPIVGQPLSTNSNFELPPSGTVDFWAVGIDCCLPSGEKFSCGVQLDSSETQALPAGLRLLREDERAFYRLAVQEWTTEFGLPARHPLFFYWSSDPVREHLAFESGMNSDFYLYQGIFILLNTFFAFLLYFFIPESHVERPIDWEKVSILNQKRLFGKFGAVNVRGNFDPKFLAYNRNQASGEV